MQRSAHKLFACLLLFFCIRTNGQAQQPDAARYPLIPWPSSFNAVAGEAGIDVKTRVVVKGLPGEFRNELAFLQGMLRRYLGADAAHVSGGVRSSRVGQASGGPVTAAAIVLEDDPGIEGREGYRLSIAATRITLTAHSPAGMFYAIETLRQLLPAGIENGHGHYLSVPCAEIADRPSFAWRGMMLDVSRHFFSTAYLRKFIDRMALYKLNKLHLHLTDDQGWRIEIKKYPNLTRVSGWRVFNDQDSACLQLAKETDDPDFQLDPTHLRLINGKTQYGGYYTQEEMKAVIRYAASRHIEIVPEIDMPGHMMAAIALYPDLTCEEQKAKDWRHGFSSPVCPIKETSLEFAKNVFGELADLFPSKYIHIGGDEVEMSDWKKSPLCQQFMQEHHLDNPAQLQSYFNNYMEAFFRSKGKTLLGWDEIVQGGIDSSAAVMFWRPWAPTFPQKATSNGNKVIMSPDGPLYFDAWPDRNTLSTVYHYNPTDASYQMTAAEQQNILGVQANLWTERVPTEGRADYLVMPRMTALAELGWTHQDLYRFYLQRLDQQYPRLDLLHIHYRLPDLAEQSERRVFTDSTSFFVESPTTKMTIHYNLDGFPTAASPILSHPLTIDHSATLRLAAFTATGQRGDLVTVTFDHQTFAPAESAIASGSGLRCELFRGVFDKTADIKGSADTSMILSDVVIPPNAPGSFGLLFRGFIDVPETGIYSFFLTSDDGSVLRIADRLVVDNDGGHSSKEKSGQVALAKGPHRFVLDYMDLGGGGMLRLEYSRDNQTPQPIPASWFNH
jgi:hexosaminidase